MIDTYQCLICHTYYDWSKVDPQTHQRYLDCDIWRCPGCNCEQDSRTDYPFLVGRRRTHRSMSQQEAEQERRDAKRERYAAMGIYFVDNDEEWEVMI